MTKQDWKSLLKAIYNENCILLLGPNMAGQHQDGTFTPFTQLLAQELVEEELEVEDYDMTHAHNLAYVANVLDSLPNSRPLDSAYAAQEFYEYTVQQPNEMQELLAELPISLIINTSPDDLMVKALRKAGKYQVQFKYYNFNNDGVEAQETLLTPSLDAPLVYNLFGYYKKPTSLVISELHQLIFTKKIVEKNPRIPNAIMNQFRNDKIYLFLGFDWEQWHLRLLLSSLKLRDFKRPAIFAPYMPIRKVSRGIKDFYAQSFNFTFVDNNPLTFLQTLQGKYQEFVWRKRTKEKIFLAFDEQDKTCVKQLHQQLQVGFPKSEGTIWHSGLLGAGEEKDEIIRQRLATATTIIFLISVDFLINSTIRNRDWKIAIERYEQGDVRLIPIIARPCDWETEQILCTLHPILPKQNEQIKAISTWDNPEEAYCNIVDELQQIML